MPVCTYCQRSGHALADCPKRKTHRENELKEEREYAKKEKRREEELQRIKDRGKRARASADEDDDEIVDDDDEDDDLEERKARARQRAEDEVAVELEAKKARQKALRKAEKEEARATERQKERRAERKREEERERDERQCAALLKRAVTRDDITAAYQLSFRHRSEQWIAEQVEERVFERLTSSRPKDPFSLLMGLDEFAEVLRSDEPLPPHEIESRLPAVLERGRVLFPEATEDQIVALAEYWKQRMLVSYREDAERNEKRRLWAQEEKENRAESQRLEEIEDAATTRTRIIAAAVAAAALMVAAALYYSFG